MVIIIYDVYGKEYRISVGERIWKAPDGAIHLALKAGYPISPGEPLQARERYDVQWPEEGRRYRITDMDNTYIDTGLVKRLHVIYLTNGDEIVILPKEERGRVVRVGTLGQPA